MGLIPRPAGGSRPVNLIEYFLCAKIEQFHGNFFPERDCILQRRSACRPEQLHAVERSDKSREFDNFSGNARIAANGDLAAAFELL